MLQPNTDFRIRTALRDRVPQLWRLRLGSHMSCKAVNQDPPPVWLRSSVNSNKSKAGNIPSPFSERRAIPREGKRKTQYWLYWLGTIPA